MMNWSYVAGLFDGVGCVSIGFRHKDSYWIITPMIIISTSPNLAAHVKSFLERENVMANVSPRVRPVASDGSQSLPSTSNIQVVSWDGCKRVCSYIHDEVVEKRVVLELLMKVISIHDRRRAERRVGKRLFSPQDLRELDGIRREIHKYARKGPKELRSYSFSSQ